MEHACEKPLRHECGPDQGPGKILHFRCSEVQYRDNFEGKFDKCPPPFKKLCHPLPPGLMHMVRHRVWSYTVQNMSFMIKVVKSHGEHLILCPPPFENGVGVHVPSTISVGRCKSVNDGPCVWEAFPS